MKRMMAKIAITSALVCTTGVATLKKTEATPTSQGQVCFYRNLHKEKKIPESPLRRDTYAYTTSGVPLKLHVDFCEQDYDEIADPEGFYSFQCTLNVGPYWYYGFWRYGPILHRDIEYQIINIETGKTKWKSLIRGLEVGFNGDGIAYTRYSSFGGTLTCNERLVGIRMQGREGKVTLHNLGDPYPQGQSDIQTWQWGGIPV